MTHLLEVDLETGHGTSQMGKEHLLGKVQVAVEAGGSGGRRGSRSHQLCDVV